MIFLTALYYLECYVLKAVNVNFRVLGCDAVKFGRKVSTFRNNVLSFAKIYIVPSNTTLYYLF